MPLLNKRRMLQQALTTTGSVALLERFPVWSGLLILNYHRVGTPGDSLFDHELWSADQNEFDHQVATLKSSCDLIGLDDLPAAIGDLDRASRSNLRFAMITFDDGYLDNYELAFPVLRSHSAPGVFFITTGFVGDRRLAWWDEISWMIRSSKRSEISLPGFFEDAQPTTEDLVAITIQRILRTCYQLDSDRTESFLNQIAEATGTGRAATDLAANVWMTWDHVREMHAAGMSMGAHTVTHPILSRLSPDEQNFEICESRLRIEEQIGEPVTAFSYPVGRRDAFEDTTREALTRNGFDWAFSYYGGMSRPGQIDRLDLPRFAVEDDMSRAEFRCLTTLPQVFARH